MSASSAAKTSKEDESKSIAVDPLENFRVLAAGAKGDALTFVIINAIKHPQVFVFGEILDTTPVKELASHPQLKSYAELLRIFAYGTYPEYKKREKELKLKEPLDVKALNKLKMLSIVEYASTQKSLQYAQLQQQLEVTSLRDLEDLIIDCVYNGLLQGKLDQRKKAFEVQWVMGRDLHPTEVDDMIKTVEIWLKASESLMTTLDEKTKQANATHEKKRAEAAALAKQKADVVESVKTLIATGDQDAIAFAMGGGGGPRDANSKGGDGKGKRKGGGGMMGAMAGGMGNFMAKLTGRRGNG